MTSSFSLPFSRFYVSNTSNQPPEQQLPPNGTHSFVTTPVTRVASVGEVVVPNPFLIASLPTSPRENPTLTTLLDVRAEEELELEQTPDGNRFPSILVPHFKGDAPSNKKPKAASSTVKVTSGTSSKEGTPSKAPCESPKEEARYPRFVLTGNWSGSPRGRARRNVSSSKVLNAEDKPTTMSTMSTESPKRRNILAPPSHPSSSIDLSCSPKSAKVEDIGRSSIDLEGSGSHISMLSETTSNHSHVSLEEASVDSGSPIDETTLFCYIRDMNTALLQLGMQYAEARSILIDFAHLVAKSQESPTRPQTYHTNRTYFSRMDGYSGASEETGTGWTSSSSSSSSSSSLNSSLDSFDKPWQSS